MPALRRRHFIAILGGTAAWPLAARAQQPEQMRRIGVLMNMAADDQQGQARVAAFRQVLQQLGRSDRNVRIDTRWGENDVDRERQYAAELVTLAPDVLLASGTVSVAALQKVTRTLPIVFVGVADPVGAGFVDSLARPGGNTTSFMEFEYSFSGKWLELLKEVVPRLTRAGVLRDAGNPRRDRSVRRHPGHGVVPRTGCDPDQCARRQRDRALDRHLRPLCKWRPGGDTECRRIGSSCADHRAGGTTQASRGKEMVPAVEHIAVVLHPETSAHAGFLRTAETASMALGIKVTSLGVHNVNEIEPAITQFALMPKAGLIVAPHPLTRGKLTIDLAAHHRLPAIYPFAFHAREGGLVAYGIDQVDQWRSAATYVDRILRGTKPADLPVQQPTKYELVINLKTARTLGLTVPPTLLARADEVIE